MAMKSTNQKSAYDLKTQAIDDLIGADSTNSPKVSEEELQKYRSHKFLGFPAWLTVLIIKFWFAAAICYFFLWGLGNYMQSVLDQLFVIAVGMGLVTDLLTNNAIRFFAPSAGANDKWMMFPKKNYGSFIGNIIYSFVIIFLVYTAYSAINLLLIKVNGGKTDIVGMGVEPILFGFLCLLSDYLLVGAKNLFRKIILEAKENARR